MSASMNVEYIRWKLEQLDVYLKLNEQIVVNVDGSCIPYVASGIGIFVEESHPLNRSEIINPPEHISGYAEIEAARVALENVLAWEGYKGQHILIRSDYKPMVDAVTYRNYSGRFEEEFEKLYDLVDKRYHGRVWFQHVYGHNGDFGQENADRLAQEATASCRENGELNSGSDSSDCEDSDSQSSGSDTSNDEGSSVDCEEDNFDASSGQDSNSEDTSDDEDDHHYDDYDDYDSEDEDSEDCDSDSEDDEDYYY